MLTPASVPGAGEAVTLTVPGAALKDSFDNAAGADTVVPFTWPTADAVIEDASAPQLARIAYKEGKLELLWDESIAPASAGTAITLNGQPTSWSAAADGYTLHGVDSIPNGRHTLAIGTGPLDLAGNGVLSAYALEFEKVSSATACNGDVVCIFTDERVLLDTLKPGQVAASTVGNSHGFHGRPVDPETGLIYMRNRYYDPELGRFLTADPLGYIDGPSMYGFAGNDPFNAGDPYGLALYAFDGTWNFKGETQDQPTNVWKMVQASKDPNRVYRGGIGNEVEYGPFKEKVGGATGYGGKSILRRAWNELVNYYNGVRGYAFDQTIDIIGFSRGSSLALEFANMVADGIPKLDAQGNPTGETWTGVRIRFIGLFDTVGSFGWAGNHINLGYRLRLPTNLPIGRAVHAVALNETRKKFPVTDVQGATQVGFIGVHSDIGGGYANGGLSNIPLLWMLGQARGAGLEFSSVYDNAPIDPTMCPHKNDKWIYANGPRQMPEGMTMYSPEDYAKMMERCASSNKKSKHWPAVN